MEQSEDPPPLLWKYRPWNNRTRSLLVNGELFFSNPVDLNDPFEFRFLEEVPRTPNEIESLSKGCCDLIFPDETESFLSDKREELSKAIEKQNAKTNGVPAISLSKFKDGIFCASKTFDNLLMWSHYADMHRGVCVGISTETMHSNKFRRVEYLDDLPVLNVELYLSDPDSAFNLISLAKSKAWKYEKEWRTVGEVGVSVFPDCVKRIVIGVKADDKTRTDIITAVNEAPHDIEVNQAVMSKEHYFLEVTPLIP